MNNKFIKIGKKNTLSNKLNHIQIQKIRICFNKAASTYDDHSHAQQTIGDNLINLLSKHQPKTDKIIDLGCGTGTITEKLALKFKYKIFYAIDIADQLLLIANNRLTDYKVKIFNHDFQNFDYENIQFDLIFSNMALHWSVNFGETLLSIYQHVVNDGYLTFSIPVEKTFEELSSCSRNKFPTINEILKLLMKIKFEKIAFFKNTITVNFDSPLSALKSIKAVGANCLLDKSETNLLGKSSLDKLINSKQHNEKKFSLTYHIGYFIARKGNGY